MRITRNKLRRLINEVVMNEIGYGGGYLDGYGSDEQAGTPIQKAKDLVDEVLTRYDLVGLTIDTSNTENKGQSTLFVLRGNRSPLTDISYVEKVKNHLKNEIAEYEFLVQPDKLDATNSGFVIQVNEI